jgi:hypothetical protein
VEDTHGLHYRRWMGGIQEDSMGWGGLDWAGLDLNDSKSAPVLELRWDDRSYS